MKLYDAIDSQRQLFLIVEHCPGKMLNTVVRDYGDNQKTNKRQLPEDVCAKIFYQMMKAMDFYHKRNICHRDIKLDNILVDPTDWSTKIIDFGFAAQVSSIHDKIRTICGTPAYMAPELCQRKEYEGAKVDMWAAGVVLYTILIGQ
jgi:serine/threonine protein kinase